MRAGEVGAPEAQRVRFAGVLAELRLDVENHFGQRHAAGQLEDQRRRVGQLEVPGLAGTERAEIEGAPPHRQQSVEERLLLRRQLDVEGAADDQIGGRLVLQRLQQVAGILAQSQHGFDKLVAQPAGLLERVLRIVDVLLQNEDLLVDLVIEDLVGDVFPDVLDGLVAGVVPGLLQLLHQLVAALLDDGVEVGVT